MLPRSEDTDRPLHPERVRFGSGEDEKSHNYNQDRKHYLEQHDFFSPNVAVPQQPAAAQLIECEAWQFYFVAEPIGIGRFGVKPIGFSGESRAIRK
jgi:hypothetical protein